MGEFSDSVMIALLPTSSAWCKQPLPHMTLVYCGKTDDLNLGNKNEMAKVALNLAMSCCPLTCAVTGVDGYGDDGSEEVLTLQTTPELLAMRSTVEKWNASEYSFSPHVTCGPLGTVGDDIPSEISFDRICVCWGDEQMSFKMI